MLYHGLAGTTLENQRQYKDVRAYILAAIRRKNSQNLCINLKLAPLWWEDKLQRIFAEANESSGEATINCLLPDISGGQEARELDPLMHEDWRVRANAATVLAFLCGQQGLDHLPVVLIDSLIDTAYSASPAFCHIARSMSVLRTSIAKEALGQARFYTRSPGLRVDSVSALAKWAPGWLHIGSLAQGLCPVSRLYGLLSGGRDARLHPPADLLEQRRPDKLIDLAAGILIGLLEAGCRYLSPATQYLLPELSLQKCA